MPPPNNVVIKLFTVVDFLNCLTGMQIAGKGKEVSTYLNPKGTAIQINDSEDDSASRQISFNNKPKPNSFITKIIKLIKLIIIIKIIIKNSKQLMK